MTVGASGHFMLILDGRQIYDASGGAAVSCLGPGPNERIIRAVYEQMLQGAYINPSTMEYPVIKSCAERLVATTNGEMVSARFYSSGTDGCEAAVKLALQYWKEKGQDRYIIIGRYQSYHGTSVGTLAVGSHKPRRDIFEANMMAVKHALPCDSYRGQRHGETDTQYVARLMEDMEARITEAGREKVAAVIIEPVVGAALGCMPPVRGYLKALRDLCDKYKILLIFDEIMCGMGRTGKMYAWQHENVVPDILIAGKGMSAGFSPMSAMFISKRSGIYETLKNGSGIFNHGHTFENFSLSCAAALELLNIIDDEKLLTNITKMGELLKQRLKDELGDLPNVGDIRGCGLFLGVEFVKNKSTKESFPISDHISEEICQLAIETYDIQFYPCGGSNGKDGHSLIIAPAYNIDESHVDLIVGRLKDVITDYFSTRRNPEVESSQPLIA